MTEILIGFLGCGGLALIVTFFMKWQRGDKSGILEEVHKVKQKFEIDKIKDVVKEQEVLSVNIKEKESLSKESVEKIKDIQKKAAKEVEEILKDDNIKRIHDQIDSDWEDL